MPAFDNLQRCGFDSLQFPIKSISIRCTYRHHDHEFLHVPGALIEKLERSIYNIEIQACFDTNVRGYGALWPDGVNALRRKFESGVTGPLVIPTIGTIPAFQPSWDQNIDMAKVRSGETVKLTFKEDQTAKFLQLALVKTRQQSMASSLDRLNAVRAQLIGVPANDQSLFDQINGAATAVLAIKDRADIYGGLLTAKLARLTQLMGEADDALESLQHPQNFDAADAFFELWDSGVKLATNLAESPRGPKFYTTPRKMSVSDIASAVYNGSTERANEILLNNRLDDPFGVLAGTKVLYFVDAGQIAA